MRNSQVVQRWASNMCGGGGNLNSNGPRLWSYSEVIGFTSPSGTKIVIDYTAKTGEYMSQTTSCHVNLAKRHADEVMHPATYRAMLDGRGEYEFHTQDHPKRKFE